MFGHSEDIHLLNKQYKNTNPQDLVAGPIVQNMDDSFDVRHEGGVLTASSIELVDTNPYDLKVGSIIQYGEPVCCGVIKWIGNLPDETDMFAGVEMVRQRSFIIYIIFIMSL